MGRLKTNFVTNLDAHAAFLQIAQKRLAQRRGSSETFSPVILDKIRKCVN
jgi:hypothetical protein